jgi:hypothetical protein
MLGNAQINTELRCEKERNLLSFKMDPQRPALFLNQADGFWHLQVLSTRRDSIQI